MMRGLPWPLHHRLFEPRTARYTQLRKKGVCALVMAVTANRFQTSKAGCVKAAGGEDALFSNIDFTLSGRLRCSVGRNRSGPRKQIQCSCERLRADGKQSYAMGAVPDGS